MGLRSYFDNLKRAFPLGAASVNPADRYWGHPVATYDDEPFERDFLASRHHTNADYLSHSASVYVCAKLRSQLLASLPLKLHLLNPKGEKDEVTSGPLFEVLTKVNS